MSYTPTEADKKDAEKFKAIAAQLLLRAEWMIERFPREVSFDNENNWYEVNPRDEEWGELPKFIYRRKPQPEYVPWTADDWPQVLGACVQNKRGAKESDFYYVGIITGCNRSVVRLAETGHNYETLFKEWERVDGTPCGKLKSQ